MQDNTVLEKSKIDFTALNDLIIDSIRDIKGKNIVKLDLRKLGEAPADFFIICEGDSTTQVSAIANNIEKRCKHEMGIMASHVEGKRESTWVLVDFFNVLVHVFHPESRTFYDIEELWSDGEVTEYQDI